MHKIFLSVTSYKDDYRNFEIMSNKFNIHRISTVITSSHKNLIKLE